MDRGPLALFGAIVAVGLGPAMWLGAQFGSASDIPTRSPVVRSEQIPSQSDDKGGGAGSAPEDPVVVLETKPRANVKPLAATPTARPSVSITRKASAKPTASPSASAVSPSPVDTSPPLTESTGPADPPTDGVGVSVPTSPPPADSGNTTEVGLRLRVL